jgi:hypothetical protein
MRAAAAGRVYIYARNAENSARVTKSLLISNFEMFCRIGRSVGLTDTPLSQSDADRLHCRFVYSRLQNHLMIYRDGIT